MTRLVRVKKIVLREITTELFRDSTLKFFGKKIKKGYRSIVFDFRLFECWFLEEGSNSGHFEVRGDTASGPI